MVPFSLLLRLTDLLPTVRHNDIINRVMSTNALERCIKEREEIEKKEVCAAHWQAVQLFLLL
jgi:hypothetical protein